MIQGLVLVEGNGDSERLGGMSLSNAKQLLLGSVTGFGTVLHLNANSAEDLNNAILKFAQVAGVTRVTLLTTRSQE